MKRHLVVAVAVSLFATACQGSKEAEPPRKDLGQAVGDIGADTALLREANGAANEVIRNAADCPAARAAIGPAYEKLDGIAKRIQTETGRVSLAAIRQQVDRVAQLCP